MLTYLSIDSFEKGIVFEFLAQSFEPLMNPELEAKLRRYDDEVFENRQTVGASLFLTQDEDELVGLASWDPRQFPKAIVGYNCILPEYQGRGFGKLQALELVRRLKEVGFTEILAKTGDHPFYVPSQKMYESCGFDEIQRNIKSSDSRYGSIDYHLVL